MPEEPIDLVVPIVCPFCSTISQVVSLSVEDDGGDIMETIEQGAGLVSILATYQLMRHVRDRHSAEFVDMFHRFPEDIIPEHERFLDKAGVHYLNTTAHAAGGAIQTTIHNN